MAAGQRRADRRADAPGAPRAAAQLLPPAAAPARRAARGPASHLRRRLGLGRAHGRRLRHRAAGRLPARLPGGAPAVARRAVGAADNAARGAGREPAPTGRALRDAAGGARRGAPLVRRPPGGVRHRGDHGPGAAHDRARRRRSLLAAARSPPRGTASAADGRTGRLAEHAAARAGAGAGAAAGRVDQGPAEHPQRDHRAAAHRPDELAPADPVSQPGDADAGRVTGLRGRGAGHPGPDLA